MDHREFVAQLGPDLRTSLQQRSDRAGLAHLLRHLKVTAEGYAAFTRDYLARRL
jgi:hypothetical protein